MAPAVQPRHSWHDSPLAFALLATASYLLLLVPILVENHFDLSVFIVAGDQFVNAMQTNSPILVRAHSSGYDGQFYYALAIDPSHAGAASHGVSIDHLSYRAQRILYPFVVHAVALGRAAFVPAAMVLVNVVALFALARMVRRRLPLLPALAIMLWPGFLTALTHDTTEIPASALLFGALIAFLDGRTALFAVLAAMATLTRETSAPLLGGMAIACAADYLLFRRCLLDWQAARPVLAAGAALVPFLLWHLYLASAWGGTRDEFPVTANLGLPLAGLGTRLYLTISAVLAVHGMSVKMRLMDIYVLAAMLLIVVSVLLMTMSAFKIWRRGGHAGAIALGWLCLLILMVLLSAKGPWAEPTATFRVFSETWLAGWLLISQDESRRLNWTIPALLPIAAVNYMVCIIQLRGGLLPPH